MITKTSTEVETHERCLIKWINTDGCKNCKVCLHELAFFNKFSKSIHIKVVLYLF